MRQRLITCFALLTFLVVSAMAESARPSPDLVVNVIGGGKISLSQYRGKVVVLAVILTSCPHCQATTRILSSLQKEFGPRGLQVLEGAISAQPDVEVPKFIQDFSPPFPVGYVENVAAYKYMGFKEDERHYVPYITFIDRNGMIRGQYDGKSPFNQEPVQAKNFRATIQKLLAEKQTSARK